MKIYSLLVRVWLLMILVVIKQHHHLWSYVTLCQCASTDVGRPDQRQEPLVGTHLVCSFQIIILAMIISWQKPWCQGPEALSVHHPSSVRRQRGAANQIRWMFLCRWMRKYLEVGKPLFHPEADGPHAHAVGEQAVPHNVPPHQPLALLLHQDKHWNEDRYEDKDLSDKKAHSVYRQGVWPW